MLCPGEAGWAGGGHARHPGARGAAAAAVAEALGAVQVGVLTTRAVREGAGVLCVPGLDLDTAREGREKV